MKDEEYHYDTPKGVEDPYEEEHEHENFYEEFSQGPDYYGNVVISQYCWCGKYVGKYTSSIL